MQRPYVDPSAIRKSSTFCLPLSHWPAIGVSSPFPSKCRRAVLGIEELFFRGSFLIKKILRMRRLPQIFEAIIPTNAIPMIYLIRWPLAGHVVPQRKRVLAPTPTQRSFEKLTPSAAFSCAATLYDSRIAPVSRACNHCHSRPGTYQANRPLWR